VVRAGGGATPTLSWLVLKADFAHLPTYRLDVSIPSFFMRIVKECAVLCISLMALLPYFG
jgi:hypothetical protein